MSKYLSLVCKIVVNQHTFPLLAAKETHNVPQNTTHTQMHTIIGGKVCGWRARQIVVNQYTFPVLAAEETHGKNPLGIELL